MRYLILLFLLSGCASKLPKGCIPFEGRILCEGKYFYEFKGE